MRYAGIIKDDIVDCDDGVCVSFWTQGCPHHCKGCHNPETWDFNGGIEEEKETIIVKILNALTENGVERKLSILGGEPLAQKNIIDVCDIIKEIREKLPNIKIYLWTGYTFDKMNFNGIYKDALKFIKGNVDVVIDGLYDEKLRDVSLPLRGSSNQRILYRGKDF
jgi:anaerobic ribonucleoside-triphosphate reductase activating protein